MKTLILAAIAAVALGLGSAAMANAAPSQGTHLFPPSESAG